MNATLTPRYAASTRHWSPTPARMSRLWLCPHKQKRGESRWQGRRDQGTGNLTGAGTNKKARTSSVWGAQEPGFCPPDREPGLLRCWRVHAYDPL